MSCSGPQERLCGQAIDTRLGTPAGGLAESVPTRCGPPALRHPTGVTDVLIPIDQSGAVRTLTSSGIDGPPWPAWSPLTPLVSKRLARTGCYPDPEWRQARDFLMPDLHPTPGATSEIYIPAPTASWLQPSPSRVPGQLPSRSVCIMINGKQTRIVFTVNF